MYYTPVKCPCLRPFKIISYFYIISHLEQENIFIPGKMPKFHEKKSSEGLQSSMFYLSISDLRIPSRISATSAFIVSDSRLWAGAR
jgi:hypothetical protein